MPKTKKKEKLPSMRELVYDGLHMFGDFLYEHENNTKRDFLLSVSSDLMLENPSQAPESAFSAAQRLWDLTDNLISREEQIMHDAEQAANIERAADKEDEPA